MRELIPDLLFIGNNDDVRNVRAVLMRGINAIIDLAIDETPTVYPREFVYCRMPIVDGGGNSPTVIRAAIQLSQLFIRNKLPVLIACRAGMSRSPAIAAAAIAVAHQIDLDVALNQISDLTACDISPALWADLKGLISDLR